MRIFYLHLDSIRIKTYCIYHTFYGIPWPRKDMQSFHSHTIVGNSASMPSTPVVSGNHSVALCQCKRYKKCGFYLWVGKILWRRASKPTPLFLPGESHGQRRLGAVFEDNDLLFWMPDVLCQHSEVVLWNLLSIEMFL